MRQRRINDESRVTSSYFDLVTCPSTLPLDFTWGGELVEPLRAVSLSNGHSSLGTQMREGSEPFWATVSAVFDLSFQYTNKPRKC